jgi:hypothetical protein
MAILQPLAQSFTIDTPGGIYATGLDLFFSQIDTKYPVNVELRTMENGIPTDKVIPFSSVSLRSISQDLSTIFVGISTDATVPTRFTFEAPVFLMSGTEYCFVVHSNSDQYKLWASEKFGYDITGIGTSGAGRKVIDNSYNGVMFRATNASTWTPDQLRDIKFTLHRAVFDNANPATIVLNEDYSIQKRLGVNPIETYKNSNIVRVHHTNHGFFPMVGTTAKSKVQLTLIVGTSNAINGIPVSELNATHNVIDVEPDSYTVRVTTLATSSGLGGGDAAVATDYRPFNVLRPSVDIITLPNTSAAWKLKKTSGQSLGGSEVPNQLDAAYSPIDINKNITFDAPAVVLPAVGRTLSSDPASKSLFLKGTLSSRANNLSPVIDLERTSAVAVSNRIDNPAATVTQYSSGSTSSGSSTIVLASATGVVAGQRVRGPYIANDALVTLVSSNTITLSSNTTGIIPTATPIFFVPNNTSYSYVMNYAAETVPLGGAALSKYITRKVELNDPASAIKIWISANRPYGSNIDVYYKIQRTDDTDGNFDTDYGWWLASTDSVDGIPYSDNPDKYSEVAYTIDYNDFQTAFGGTLSDGDVQFTAFAIKIVFTSNNSSRVPSCKEFRAVAVS